VWPIQPEFRWEPGRSHTSFTRVEVWSQGSLVESAAPIIDGTITERWVTGPRASLSLSVEPSPEWLEWLVLPDLELRPFAGISWGRSRFECPLGVFPTMPPARSLPASTVSVSADDRWQVVTQNDLEFFVQGPSGSNIELAARLMSEAGLGEVSVSVSRRVLSPALMWDKSRDELIKGYLEPTGAEAFVDRTGVAVIRDRTAVEGRDLTDGEDGTVVNITSTQDWSKVVNVVAAASSKNDVVVVPQSMSITNWGHPAHESKIGRRVLRYTSPLISSEDEARVAAQGQLDKLSAPALSWSVSCVPDPTRMPGDLITVTTGLGAVQATVQEVTHPLGGAAQSVKLGAAP
jgi:hypothetical protein